MEVEGLGLWEGTGITHFQKLPGPEGGGVWGYPDWGGVSRAPPRWLKLGALLVAEGAGAGFRGSRGAGGAGVLPSRPLSRQRRFSWFLLQMLLLGVVGAAVGRVAGSGGDSLGFRGLLFLVFLLSSLFPVWPWLTLKTL